MTPGRERLGTTALMLGALGVVFGDIGTSPLYALQAVFLGSYESSEPTDAEVYGVISLVFWTITLVVSIKYVTFILRADNDGEGGIMALIALVRGASLKGRLARGGLLGLGLLGASLFYGDGMITPAVSVLSAVEGLDVAAPDLSNLIVPIALAVLTLLFAIQRYGSGALGRLFGPVMGVWFVVIAACGLAEVVEHPQVLRALSPSYGAEFIGDHGGTAFVVLGSVVLTVTGAEALYADIGHFGRSPIRRAWFWLVFPALTLNYMGQGALVLHAPEAIENPFYLLVPHWARIPMVLLATVATVIASQAVISGVFSITHKAVQLGFLPRLAVRHTSARHPGQVYVPAVNWALWVAVCILVVAFGTAEHLASAYGVAVTGTMISTTVLFLVVARSLWHRSVALVVAGGLLFLTIDIALFSSTLLKIEHGGWLPLLVAVTVFTVLATWRKGSQTVTRRVIEEEGPLRLFVEEVRSGQPPIARPPGTAVFLAPDPDTTPLAARANVEHNQVLHRRVLIVSIRTLNAPRVDDGSRLVLDDRDYRDDGITRVTASFGFLERPNLPRIVELVSRQGVAAPIDPTEASYFLSRITLVRTDAPGMPRWQKRLFIVMSHNEGESSEYFGLPEERTVTMGSLIEL